MGHVENRVSGMEDKIEKLNHSEKVSGKLTKLKTMEKLWNATKRPNLKSWTQEKNTAVKA